MINNEELKEIFNGIKNGNDDAFNIFYEKCHKLVYGISFSICKNNADSEDIAQNFFTKMYSLDKEKFPESNETSWIYRVSKNETIDFLRKKKPLINVDEIYDIEGSNSDLEEIIDRDSFEKLIQGLSPKEKEIMSLKVLADLSFDEISKMLGEPVSTVKWRYYRSLSSLRLCITSLLLAFTAIFAGSLELVRNNYSSDLAIVEKDEESTKEDLTSESLNDELSIQYKDDNVDEGLSLNSITSAESNIQVNTINNMKIYVCFTGVFLIISIICAIFFKKYQLKLKKKSSK